MPNSSKSSLPLKSTSLPASRAQSTWHWLRRNGRLAILLVSFFVMQARVEQTTTGVLKTVLLLGLVFIEFGLIAGWEIYSVR